MNRKQQKILASIFAVPTLGGGRGSRVAFVFANGLKWEEHRPHPQKEAKKYQVESARRLLQKLGYGNE